MSNSYDLKADSIDPQRLSKCGHTGKQFVFRFGPKDAIEAMSHRILVIKESTLIDLQVPDSCNRWVSSDNRKTERTGTVLDSRISICSPCDVTSQRKDVAQELHILIGKVDLTSCFVATRLLRCPAGVNSNRSCSETVEDIFNRLTEAISIGKQQHDRGNTPRHSQHGEHGLPQVVAHCGVCLLQEIAFHLYSFRRASTGCSNAAFRAGYNPAAIPARASDAIASAAVAGTSLGVSQPGGDGNSESADMSAADAPIPIPPLNNVRNAPSAKN